MKKLYAEEFDKLIGIFNNGPDNPEIYDKKINMKINELYKLLDKIKPYEDLDDVKILYINFPCGGIKYFYDYEDLKREGEVCNHEQFEKYYQDYYPDNEVWYKLSTTKYQNYRYVSLDNKTIIYADMNESLDYFENERLYKLLSYIIIKVKEVLKMLENNTYNDYIMKNLPFKNRFGVIKRSDYWKINEYVKKELLEEISKTEIEAFVLNAKEDTNERIVDMTANKYFYCVRLAFQSIGRELGNLSDIELYKKYADGRDEGLTNIDLDSKEAFDDWYKDKDRRGGHPWEIIRGHSYSRVNLMVGHDDKGYYLGLDGTRILMKVEIAKIYLELIKNNIPVKIYEPNIIKDALTGDDYLGIVPDYLLLVYCEGRFKKFKPKQFIHFNDDMIKYAKWEEIEKCYLKNSLPKSI